GWVPGPPLPGDNKPTLLSFDYGRGKVVLSAYHPFAIPGGRIRGLKVLPEEDQLKMPTAAQIAPQSLDDMNYQSWNVLPAAFRFGAGEEVKPPSVAEVRGARRHMPALRPPFPPAA